MKLVARTILLVCCFICFGIAADLQACSCMAGRPVCESVGSDKAIFVGKVVGSKQQQTDSDGQSYDVGEIYFEVLEAFTGVNTKTQVTVRSGTGGGDCGYWFSRGETYLIYAYGNDASSLSTGICSRTRPISSASEDLDFLRKMPLQASGVRIFGKVETAVSNPFEENSSQYKPLKGVKLKVKQLTGAKQTREVITDAEGKYEVVGVAAGQYQIIPTIPRTSEISEYSLEAFVVKNRGCTERNFLVENNSRIGGRVVDIDKKPLKEVWVELLPAYGELPTRPLSNPEKTDDDGSFEFENVPTGSYVLAVNHLQSPDDDSPFRTTYYPGASTFASALIIEIRPGQNLEEIIFKMPERLERKSIRGSIVWPDGSAAAEAEVHLEDLESPGWCVNGCSLKADKYGNFSFTVYSGRSYRIKASGNKLENGKTKEYFAPMPSFSTESENLSFKMVLELEIDPTKLDDPKFSDD